MGGVKKRPVSSSGKNRDTSPTSNSSQAQSQTQKKEDSKKSSGQGKQRLSVIIEESAGRKALQNMKTITIQGLARTLGVKVSVANSYIKNLEAKGSIKNVGGYSGHRVYQLIQSA
jgi:small subunit ribosomal protein S25e